jgi:hypothetical protein
MLGPDKCRTAQLPGSPAAQLERNRVAWRQAERSYPRHQPVDASNGWAWRAITDALAAGHANKRNHR